MQRVPLAWIPPNQSADDQRKRDMATFHLPARRLLLAGGFAVAVAAAPVAVFATPIADGPPVAQCPSGEETDQYTGKCVPHTVPNSGAVPSKSFTGGVAPGQDPGAAPEPGARPTHRPGYEYPFMGNIPCVGAQAIQCYGVGLESAAEGPAPAPKSTVESSPTVTGHSG